MDRRYIISEQIKSEIDYNEIKDTYDNIEYELENGKIDFENMDQILSECISMLGEFNFIERTLKFMNEGANKEDIMNGNEGILMPMKEYLKYNKETKGKENIILLNMHDFYEQFIFFDKKGERTFSELLANTMFLSNSIAHTLSQNALENDFNEHDLNIKEMINMFYKIKNICLEELLKQRKNGEKILIEKDADNNGESTYTIALPGYFEPFCIHSKKIETELEKYDKVNFKHIDNRRDLSTIKTTMPFKVSEEKDEIIRKYLYSPNRRPKELDKVYDRLKWYVEMQEKFQEIGQQKNEKEEKNEVIEDIEELKKILEEQDLIEEQIDGIIAIQEVNRQKGTISTDDNDGR